MDAMCQSNIGINATTGGDAFLQSLNFTTAHIANTTRVLVVNGLADPVTALSPRLSVLPAHSRQHARVMYVGQSAHTETASMPFPDDSDALKMARVYVMNSVREWLDGGVI